MVCNIIIKLLKSQNTSCYNVLFFVRGINSGCLKPCSYSGLCIRKTQWLVEASMELHMASDMEGKNLEIKVRTN